MAVDPTWASKPSEPGSDPPNRADAEPVNLEAPTSDGELRARTDAPNQSRPSDPPPRRALKLVITVSAGDNQEERAVLALGSEGCDPLLRVVEPGGMQAALQAVPALLAEAEARWQHQPRHPAANRAAPSTDRAAKTSAPRTPTSTSAPPNPPSGSSSPGPGQMTLFA